MSLESSLAKTNRDVADKTSKLTSNGDKKPGKLGGMVGNASGIQKNVAGSVVGMGNIVAKASGAFGGTLGKKLADALTGKTEVKYNPVKEIDSLEGEKGEKGGLKNFYSQFSGISLNSIDRVDPLNTFECEFRFFPNVIDLQNVTKIENSTSQSVGGVLKDSTIGKLFQQIMFRNSNSKQPVESDLIVNLGIYIQKLTPPRLVVEGGEEVTTLVGKFPVPGNLVIPESNNLQMEVVNVESPVQENIFYPWMRETTLPIWSYDSQPFTTATITLDFTEHSNVKYHFFGCRPTDIQLIQPDQAPQQNLTRNVQFTFDFMTVETEKKDATQRNSLPAVPSGGKKNGNSLTGLANAALFSATNTLKL